MFETLKQTREDYREKIPFVFDVTADLYYAHWGEFFHLAIFDRTEEPFDFDRAYEQTHQRYLQAIRGTDAGRILELASGGGAFSAWMAARTRGEIVGIDISPGQLAHARGRLNKKNYANLRFVEHDIMRIDELDETPFDAAVCLDAACYLPDKGEALRALSTRLRPGARFLLVDWCRPEEVTALQHELILEPFYHYWCIPEMETVRGYEQAFKGAGFHLIELEDLSGRVAPNWERGYRAGISALADSIVSKHLLTVAAIATKYGRRGVRLAKDQFYAAMFAKAAADAGLLRYVYFLGEKC